MASIIGVVGCASAPPLDHAELITISAATPAEIAREAQADRGWWKNLFRGGSIRDPQRGLLTFKTDEYDAFEAEEKRLSGLTSAVAERRSLLPNWPVLRIGFVLKTLPVSPGTTGLPANVQLYLCDTENPLIYSVGWGDILWHGVSVTVKNANQIQGVIAATGQPQNYEVILRYLHSELGGSAGDVITVKPPEKDLCLARYQRDWLFAALGKPLRLDKATVTDVLSNFPKEVRRDRGNIDP